MRCCPCWKIKNYMMNDVGLLCWDEKYSANRTSPYEPISFFFFLLNEKTVISCHLQKKNKKTLVFKRTESKIMANSLPTMYSTTMTFHQYWKHNINNKKKINNKQRRQITHHTRPRIICYSEKRVGETGATYQDIGQTSGIVHFCLKHGTGEEVWGEQKLKRNKRLVEEKWRGCWTSLWANGRNHQVSIHESYLEWTLDRDGRGTFMFW